MSDRVLQLHYVAPGPVTSLAVLPNGHLAFNDRAGTVYFESASGLIQQMNVRGSGLVSSVGCGGCCHAVLLLSPAASSHLQPRAAANITLAARPAFPPTTHLLAGQLHWHPMGAPGCWRQRVGSNHLGSDPSQSVLLPALQRGHRTAARCCSGQLRAGGCKGHYS